MPILLIIEDIYSDGGVKRGQKERKCENKAKLGGPQVKI